jgi:hypothetical protein
MNFRLSFFLVQFAATFARRFHGIPKKWVIKALEPKAPVLVHQNRQKRIQAKYRKQLWQKNNLIRY